MSVFAACRSLVPFAFDLVPHDLLERRARRQRGASVQKYCTGYDIGVACVRKRPFRPIRLRMVERVQMLAGDVITRRSCRPSWADWSACTLHLPYVVNAKSMCVSSSSWMTSGRPPPVAYSCGSCDPCDPVTISAKNRLCLQPVMMSGMSCVCAELGGSGKLAGDHGGNVEPRVAAACRTIYPGSYRCADSV